MNPELYRRWRRVVTKLTIWRRAVRIHARALFVDLAEVRADLIREAEAADAAQRESRVLRVSGRRRPALRSRAS